MKKLLTLSLCLALVGNLPAADQYNSKDFLRAVQQATGGPNGINVNAPKEELVAQLRAAETLLPLAPDQTGLDAANAQISVYLAALGNRDEALLALGRIVNRPNREKRRLQVIAILDGNTAAVQALGTLLADATIPETEQVIYVEKVATSLRGADRYSKEMAALCVTQLAKTKFRENNVIIGQRLLVYCEGALRAKVVDEASLSVAVRHVLDTSPRSAKMTALIEPAEKLALILPAPPEAPAPTGEPAP